MKNKLTQLQAFKAMMKFIEGYYEKTNSDDIAVLLSVSSLLYEDDTPTDSALWEDWLDAIGDNKKQLTVLETLVAMTKFLEGYHERDNSKDIQAILSDAKHLVHSATANPILKHKWQESVNYILSEKGQKYGYLELHK